MPPYYFRCDNITGSRQIDDTSSGFSLYRTGQFTPSPVTASGSNYFLITVQTPSPVIAWESEMYCVLLAYSIVSTSPMTHSFLFFTGNFLQTLTGNPDLAIAPVYWYNFIPNTKIPRVVGDAALRVSKAGTTAADNKTLFHSGYYPLRVHKTTLYTAPDWNTAPTPPVINNQNGVTYGTSVDMPADGRRFAMFNIVNAKRLYPLSAEYIVIPWRLKNNKLQSVGSIIRQGAFQVAYAAQPQWGVTTIDVTGYYPFTPSTIIN